MEIGYAVTLGVIQGLTEFLPVSSSGHLVLFQDILGFREPQIFFDISVHVGTLLAICAYFFKDLKAVITALFAVFVNPAGPKDLLKRLNLNPDARLAGMILVGTVPTGIIGLLIRPVAEKVFSSIGFVGIMLLVTGAALWLTRGFKREGRSLSQITVWDALCIGIVQGVAVMPGISRSGATIAAGLFRGVGRDASVRYSFLLSIPAVAGAMLLELGDVSTSCLPPAGAVMTGGFAAAVVGYFSLKVLIRVVGKGAFHVFAPYCWFAGMVALARAM